MAEKYEYILSQYDLHVERTQRVRNGILCETDRGCKLLKEYKGSLKRLLFEEELLLQLRERGFFYADFLNRTGSGEVVSIDEDGTNYQLRDWYEGRECSHGNRMDLFLGAEILGELHVKMTDLKLEHGDYLKNENQNHLIPELQRHNRELKRVKRYMKEQRGRTAFETELFQALDLFLPEAEAVTGELMASPCEALCREARERGNMVHGSYHYHNIWVNIRSSQPGGTAGMEAAATLETAPHRQGERGRQLCAVTNFERASCNIQITDFYMFFRKVMEKNNWNGDLGKKLMDIYRRTRQVPEAEWQIFVLLLRYPEKFWKIANYYMNHRKTWLPERNMDKLQQVLRGQEQKNKFLQTI